MDYQPPDGLELSIVCQGSGGRLCSDVLPMLIHVQIRVPVHVQTSLKMDLAQLHAGVAVLLVEIGRYSPFKSVQFQAWRGYAM